MPEEILPPTYIGVIDGPAIADFIDNYPEQFNYISEVAGKFFMQNSLRLSNCSKSKFISCSLMFFLMGRKAFMEEFIAISTIKDTENEECE